MEQNQQWQTKGTSSKTLTNGLAMVISQYVTVPKFCKDVSKVCNHWDKHSHCQTGLRQYTHHTFHVEMLPDGTAAGARAKNFTEIKSEAWAVLGSGAVHISAVNMSYSCIFSWSINIAKSSQDKVACVYFNVLALLSSRENKSAAVNFHLCTHHAYPGESYYRQKSCVQTVTSSGRKKEG